MSKQNEYSQIYEITIQSIKAFPRDKYYSVSHVLISDCVKKRIKVGTLSAAWETDQAQQNNLTRSLRLDASYFDEHYSVSHVLISDCVKKRIKVGTLSAAWETDQAQQNNLTRVCGKSPALSSITILETISHNCCIFMLLPKRNGLRNVVTNKDKRNLSTLV
ncbi:hypothetical protein BD770DRAFT_409618 [Pilaira anomala]|nr:hypothetical protein BD770DRAFT_409618 [Pilaira anomala]